ncbi:MAG: protein kinase [Thermoanaerobaculia bacterium]
MSQTPAPVPNLPPARRSPTRAIRDRIDLAAIRIAGDPARWSEVVKEIRKSLGRPPLPVELSLPQAYQFVSCDVRGFHAAYPVAAPIALDGGGMNTVQRSWDLFAGRELAVRKHHPAVSAVEELLRSLRDALVRERLGTLPRHPVIQRFWASGLIDGERCDVFDFAPGMSLARYVARRGLTLGVLIDVGIHAARGLDHLHRHGLIHADVKPENLCVEGRVTAEGETSVRVRLIDFDIVSSPEEQLNQYSLGNSLEGTLPYMPAENFSQKLPEDPAEGRRMVLSKDVFALGLTLYRVAAGRLPKNFPASENALLKSKIRKDEAILEFPPGIPEPLRVLIASMCRSVWRERPTLAQTIAALHSVDDALTFAEREQLVNEPLVETTPDSTRVEASASFVGPYRVLDRNFAPRFTNDGQAIPLAELEDPFGRRLVGVPYAFPDEERELLFYEERRALLKDLNAVRLLHPELFPGGFRDLVRERTADEHLVWIVRPMLEGVKKLPEYLAEIAPDATVKDRVGILRRVAESLAVLEDAGYTLPALPPELVFFIPRPGETMGATAEQMAMTRPIDRLFDLPASGATYRQELMGMASAQRRRLGARAELVADVRALAESIGVTSGLSVADRLLVEQLDTLQTWRERAEVLVLVEMQCQ